MSRTQAVVSQSAKLQLQMTAFVVLFNKETYYDFQCMVCTIATSVLTMGVKHKSDSKLKPLTITVTE
jgi:hypothetical protein